VLHRRDFVELRADVAAVDRVLVAALAQRVEQTTNQVLELLMPLEARVWRRLLALHDGYGGTGIGLTQDDVARMAGGSRPRVNRVLREAEAAGVLRLERGRITVTDRAGLELLARRS
jgi:CRP-like cAMP-binding protein